VAQPKTATRSGKSRQSSKSAKSSKSRQSSKSAKKSTKTASRKTKASSSKGRSKSGSKAARDVEIAMDRRRDGRRGEDRGQTGESPVLAAPKLERRKKVNRRRQIDPTTCERDYSDDEIQFMSALDAYKRASGRMFPTCSEVLEVVRSLGYVKLSSAETRTYEETTFLTTSAGAAADSYPTDPQPSP